MLFRSDPIKLPSHHGPDVKTVLPKINIETTAMKASTTLMHMHTVNISLAKKVSREDVIAAIKPYPRMWLIPSWLGLSSTASLMEFARELGRPRHDIMENCIWEESVSVDEDGELNLFQGIHQESDVIPENVDCIRAMAGTEKDNKKSMEKTNKTLGIGNFDPWKLTMP